MAAPITWRELYRCDDLAHARSVATSIAAMEFDVRLNAVGFEGVPVTSDEESFHGPYVIEVNEENWHELKDILDEVISEQVDFDQWVEKKQFDQNRKMLLIWILVALGAGCLVAVKAISM